MLSIGEDFALVCGAAIVEGDRERVLGKLAEGRTVLQATLEQTEKHFACNILELRNKTGEKVLVLSEAARAGLGALADQLQKTHKLAVFPVPVIEKVGGGSARCMVAEVLL
jgi:hypothetical protein